MPNLNVARQDHSSCCCTSNSDGINLYVFGGFSYQGLKLCYANSIEWLERVDGPISELSSWRIFEISNPSFKPREHPCITQINDRKHYGIVIFGGTSIFTDEDQCLGNDIWKFDTRGAGKLDLIVNDCGALQGNDEASSRSYNNQTAMLTPGIVVTFIKHSCTDAKIYQLNLRNNSKVLEQLAVQE